MTDAVGAGAERKCADAVGNGLRRKLWQRQHSKDLPVNQQVGQGLWNRSTIPEQSLEKGKGKGFAFNKSRLLCEQGSNLCVVRVRQLVNSRTVYSAARSTSTPSASCSTTKQDSNGWHLLCHFIDRGGGGKRVCFKAEAVNEVGRLSAPSVCRHISRAIDQRRQGAAHHLAL